MRRMRIQTQGKGMCVIPFTLFFLAKYDLKAFQESKSSYHLSFVHWFCYNKESFFRVIQPGYHLKYLDNISTRTIFQDYNNSFKYNDKSLVLDFAKLQNHISVKEIVHWAPLSYLIHSISILARQISLSGKWEITKNQTGYHTKKTNGVPE